MMPRRPRTLRRTPAIESLETRRLMVYQASSSDFEFENLSPGALGVATLLNNTDDGFGEINLATLPVSHRFKYFGEIYDKVFVSANGLITLVNGSTTPTNGDLTSTPPQRTLAAFWDDWDTSGGSGPTDSAVLYKYSTEHGGELIIEWNNVSHADIGGTNGVTFQAILDLTGPSGNDTNGEMKFQYADLDAGHASVNNGASATVGIKNVGTALGTNRVLVFQNGGGPQAGLVGTGECVEIEDDGTNPAPVQLLSSSFGFESTPHTLTMNFAQGITGLQPSDLVVTPVGGTPFSPVSVAGEGLNTVTFTFSGTLADGRYDAVIAAGAIFGTGGAPSNAPVTAQFFFLTGDANRDARVNLSDFNVLAANFGQTGRTFSQGDFNYDGNVNLTDFNLLAARFGTSVAPAATTATSQLFGSSSDADRDDDLLA